MFKLKQVELQGFKSFADRTRLEFGAGTAAIVGPNGCGKSNLSDAISWVLGEQSARMLRGDRMADVIFNGSGKRPPTSMAEVSMTLVRAENSALAPSSDRPGNSEETLATEIAPAESNGNGFHAETKRELAEIIDGAEEEEVVVTRRLFRSGESEYLLNGRTCRLRDIQDLFMGTGLGPESYAIIEQGRIGQILSSKPSDRRAIIEEAAGISKFKSRKRLAEAKLESSRQNLARISDILEEVSKQVHSLKRQASKAERYRQLHGEYRAKQRVVLASELVRLQATHERLTAEQAALREACAESAGRLEEVEREGHELARVHSTVEEQLTGAREKLAQGELEMERLRSRVEQARRETAGIEKRSAEMAVEREQAEARLQTLASEIAEREVRIEEVRRELNAAQQAASVAADRQSETADALAAAEKQVDSLRQAVLTAVSRAAELRNQLVQAEESGFAIDRQLARARTERAAAAAEQERLAAELSHFEREHDGYSSAFAQLSQSAAEISASLDTARNEESACRQKLESLREEYSKSSARKQALEESLARHAYSTDSVRKLLSGERQANGTSNGFRPVGLLADFVEVTAGYEEMVEEFLRAELDSVVVEGREDARHGMALVESEGSGRAAFFVQRLPSNGNGNGHAHHEPMEGPRPAGVTASLQEVMRFEPKLGLNGDVAFPVLASTYVVEDRQIAEALAEAHPLCHFLTKSGEHYHHRMVSGGKKASAGPLALRRDFRELDRHTAELEEDVSCTENDWTALQAQVRRNKDELTRLGTAMQNAEKQSLVVNEKLQQARRGHDLVVSRMKTIGQECSLLEEEKQKIDARRAELELGLAQANEDRSTNDRALAEAMDHARQLRASLDQVGHEVVAAQSLTSGLSEKLSGLETDCRRLKSQAAETRERQGRLEIMTAALADETARLRYEGQQAAESLDALAITQEGGRAGLASIEQQASDLRSKREVLEPTVDSRRAELDGLRDRRSAAEVALARAESDLAHHVQRCNQELGLAPDALLDEIGPEHILAAEALSQASQEAEELRARMERIGPVNMMALEELGEAEERRVFLDAQRQDLLASINDTAQTIREIDHVSHRQFREAFQAVNAFFSETFRTLFGGGNGEMRLSDDTDPESGIEIVAQPPGKRLQNVLLLSGGEKALTALALLIGIFRFTPSPFCILDEVDAPLDDANVERFTRLIEHMSGQTQFILITHNKRTMEICSILYGVTMQEPGVSRLVSVRMEQMEFEPAALPA